MKKNQVIMIILITILFCVGLVSLYFTFSKVAASKSYTMHVTVSDTVGFNLDVTDTDIFFGKVSQGGSVSKTINITNTYYTPLKTMYKKSGDLAGFVTVPESTTLNPGETYSAVITLNVPDNAEYGDFDGKFRILLLKT